MDLTAGLISGFAGALLSLALNYFPGLNTWFAALESSKKSFIILVSLFIVSVLIALSSCADLWVVMSCDKGGFVKLAEAFLFALIANQSVYKIIPQTKEVRQIKEDNKK
jgi:hypothetical protein